MLYKTDTSKIINKGLDFNTFFILQSLYNKENLDKFYELNIKIETKFLDKAIELGYLENKGNKNEKYKFENLSVTPLFFDDFLTDPIKEGVAKWIDQWYDLWPKGVKSGGFYIRSDKIACCKKLTDFCNKYPEYNKGIIVSATKKYLDIMKQKQYQFCKLAPYFIIKDGVSMLEGYCQEMLNNIEQFDAQDTDGRTQLGTKDF